MTHLILALIALAALYQLAKMLLFIILWLVLQPVRLVLTLMMWAIPCAHEKRRPGLVAF